MSPSPKSPPKKSSIFDLGGAAAMASFLSVRSDARR